MTAKTMRASEPRGVRDIAGCGLAEAQALVRPARDGTAVEAAVRPQE
ncbi:hypothetical protein ABT324_29735 [Saccharopolyspora sp. NPDC000359]